VYYKAIRAAYHHKTYECQNLRSGKLQGIFRKTLGKLQAKSLAAKNVKYIVGASSGHNSEAMTKSPQPSNTKWSREGGKQSLRHYFVEV
jgi:hypothetical protein